jgi:type VI protein secretion system component VasK
MTEIFPFLVVMIVLSVVARSLVGLNDVAARAGRLRPVTVIFLTHAPVAAFSVWAIWILWRLGMHDEGYSLWPFELAMAVIFWLTWIAIVALVVTLHEQLLRLFRSTASAAPDDALVASSSPD